MANTRLYEKWTWNIGLPEPFDKAAHTKSSTDKSKYNTTTTVATYHGPVLQALMEYMEMDTTISSSMSNSAIGTQNEQIMAEYHSRTGQIHVVVFNKKSGSFRAGCFTDANSNATVYMLSEKGCTGSALFFTLIPEAMKDEEFKENYDTLLKCKEAGFSDMATAEKAAFILCDNFYRRIENAKNLGDTGIKIADSRTGNIPLLTEMNLKNGNYSPTSVLFGEFEILTATPRAKASVVTDKKDLIGKYKFSERDFSATEQLLIPTLEDWYVIPPEVVTICSHAKVTTSSAQPMRNFMMRGPAGTGKTEAAKAIAAGLGLPYLSYTCSANTEIYDFLGQMLPENEKDHTGVKEYPTFLDLQMDPSSAYEKLTGIYKDDVSEDEVYQKLLEVMETDARAESKGASTGQRFRYVETPLVEAMKNGYVIEIQEPTVISNPGVLVGLNALLDRCASITLTTGEVIHRHPDTVVIITTNNNYAGCRDMNQSVISRMNLVFDMDAPSVSILTERAMNITGCTDRSTVTLMASTVMDVNEHCKESMITDGSCGVRELISWVQSYMVSGNALESAKYTILASASADPECREEILNTCIEQKFAA